MISYSSEETAVLCTIARMKLFEILDGNYGKRKDFLENISTDVSFFAWIQKWRTGEYTLSDAAIWLKSMKNFWQKQTMK